MFKKLQITFLLSMFLTCSAFAQSGTVTGVVTDAGNGEPLIGTTVQLVELSMGDATDMDGRYEINNVPAGTYTLQVTYVGFTTFETQIEVGSGTVTVDVELEEDVLAFDDVVVTALGMETNERAVTFATQKIDAEELNISQETNIKTGLAGKVAGVQIVGQAGSKLGDFGNIRIRGAISLTSTYAEPLYVVDGVPVNNPNMIDMNSVGEINVLKGPNATALYGQRGENGVVLISTKSAARSGVSVELTNSTTFEDVAYLPNFQNKYGQGYDGAGEWATIQAGGVSPAGAPYPAYLDVLDGARYIFNGYADESWGPEFDGQPYAPWYTWYPDSPYYGQTVPYEAAPNNVENFYDTGVTSQTGVAINYSDERYSGRLSFTNLGQGGLIPFSSLDKQFINGNFDIDITEKFNAGINVGYSTQTVNGDVYSDGYGNNSSGSLNSWFARNTEMDKLRELKDLETPEGYLASWNSWGPAFMGVGGGYAKPAFWFNPYSWMERYDITRNTDNLLLNADLSYQISDHLELSASANTTSETYNRRYELPNSLAFSADQTGNFYNYWVNSFGESQSQRKEHNLGSRLNYKTNFDEWTVDAMVGGQIRIQSYNSIAADMSLANYQNGGLIIPDVYNFGNSAERIIPTESSWNKKVYSLFTKATVGYGDFLYLDGTYRQDYSSALPADNNGYGYPSIGASFVFSEFIDNDVLSYGKVRAGWAQVGNDVAAEVIDQTFRLQQDPFTNPTSGAPAVLIYTSSQLVDPNIKPALNSSYEVGLDLRFVEDRIGLTATYYSETRENEIIGTSLSPSTGYSSFLTNAGSTERQGLELSVDANVIQTTSLVWNTTINWATNETIVTSLPDGAESYEVGAGSAFGYVSLTHRLNKEWGQLRGPAIARTEDGTPIINSATGTYQVVQNQYLGSVLPDWTGGWLNSLSYKGFNLTALIDFQKGGNFFSLSEQWGQYSGLLEETADLNDLGNPKRDPVTNDASSGGVHVTGVDENGNAFDDYIPAISYYGQWQANTIASPFVHDASFVKLREVSLTYTLPQRWFGDYLRSATVGLVGRNLWMIAVSDENVHGWDPSELSQSYGEDGQLPGTRSFGFNVKVNF